MSKTVHIIVCASHHGDPWVHGVYESRQSAERVFQRVRADSYDTVRLVKARIRAEHGGTEAQR